MPSAVTRARAWALRTFAGRKPSEAGWDEELPARNEPPVRYRVGDLEVVVTPVGTRAVGVNAPSSVFEVRVQQPSGGRGWSSRYGLAAGADARAAAIAALDELWEIWSDQPGWESRITAGMNEDEIEAMLDSPSPRADVKAARLLAPLLEPARNGEGGWAPEEVPPPA